MENKFYYNTKVRFSDIENKDKIKEDLNAQFPGLFTDDQQNLISSMIVSDVNFICTSPTIVSGADHEIVYSTLGDVLFGVIHYYNELSGKYDVLSERFPDSFSDINENIIFDDLYCHAVADMMLYLHDDFQKYDAVSEFTFNTDKATPHMKACSEFISVMGKVKEDHKRLMEYELPKDNLTHEEMIIRGYQKAADDNISLNKDFTFFKGIIFNSVSSILGYNLIKKYIRDLQPLRHLNTITEDKIMSLSQDMVHDLYVSSLGKNYMNRFD